MSPSPPSPGTFGVYTSSAATMSTPAPSLHTLLFFILSFASVALSNPTEPGVGGKLQSTTVLLCDNDNKDDMSKCVRRDFTQGPCHNVVKATPWPDEDNAFDRADTRFIEIGSNTCYFWAAPMTNCPRPPNKADEARVVVYDAAKGLTGRKNSDKRHATVRDVEKMYGWKPQKIVGGVQGFKSRIGSIRCILESGGLGQIVLVEPMPTPEGEMANKTRNVFEDDV